MSYTILNINGQITIPKSIRTKLGLKPNDKFYLLVRDGQNVVLPKKDILELEGVIKTSGPQDLKYIRKFTMHKQVNKWMNKQARTHMTPRGLPDPGVS